MKKFLFVIVLGALSIVLGTSFYSISKSKKYTPRADFEPSSSTMVVWANSYKDNLLPFISTISKYDHVTVVVKDRNSIEQVKSELHGQYASMKNISFSMNPSQESAEDIWIRDFGPMIITNGSKMKVVDFRYYINDYSNFDSRFAAKNKMEVVRSKVLSVGGAREFNGKGTVILVKSHEKKHNKNLSLEEIENEFKMVLGQEKVIWLEEGLPYDDDFYDGPIVDTIYPNGLHGHIDEFCRFANANTILISVPRDSDSSHTLYDITKQRMQRNYDILTQSTDQDGNKFKVVKVPVAPYFLFTGFNDCIDKQCIAVTSYLNYAITNKLVIIPKYYKDGYPIDFLEKDELARTIFETTFPGKKIIQMDPMFLNMSSGGFHCISLNIPKIKRRA